MSSSWYPVTPRSDRQMRISRISNRRTTPGPGGGETIDIKSADRDDIGTEDQDLDHVGAAIDAAIDHDVGTSGDRFDNFRQGIDRSDLWSSWRPPWLDT